MYFCPTANSSLNVCSCFIFPFSYIVPGITKHNKTTPSTKTWWGLGGSLQSLSWVGWSSFKRTSLSWAFFFNSKWEKSLQETNINQLAQIQSNSALCKILNIHFTSTLHPFLKTEVLYSCEDLVIHHHYKWDILKMLLASPPSLLLTFPPFSESVEVSSLTRIQH